MVIRVLTTKRRRIFICIGLIVGCIAGTWWLLGTAPYQPDVRLTTATRYGQDLFTINVELSYDTNRINISPDSEDGFTIRFYSEEGSELTNGYYVLERSTATPSASNNDSQTEDSLVIIKRNISIRPGGSLLAFLPNESNAQISKRRREHETRAIALQNAVRSATEAYAIVHYEIPTNPRYNQLKSVLGATIQRMTGTYPPFLVTTPSETIEVQSNPISIR